MEIVWCKHAAERYAFRIAFLGIGYGEIEEALKKPVRQIHESKNRKKNILEIHGFRIVAITIKIKGVTNIISIWREGEFDG